MNWADLVILGVVVLSALVSLMRGFVKEALSLVVWIAAIWLAFTFCDSAAGLFQSWIGIPSARTILAFILIFLITLLIGGILSYLVGQLVARTGLSGTDRMVGIIFGAARGIVLVTAVVMLCGMTPFPRDRWWQESVLLPYFERSALWLGTFLPESLAAQISYANAIELEQSE